MRNLDLGILKYKEKGKDSPLMFLELKSQLNEERKVENEVKVEESEGNGGGNKSVERKWNC